MLPEKKKKDTNELTLKKVEWKTENKLIVTKGDGGSKKLGSLENISKIYKQIIENRYPTRMYSTWNFVITYKGKESRKKYIYIWIILLYA